MTETRSGGAQVLEPQRGHDRDHRRRGRLVAADLHARARARGPCWRGGRSTSPATARGPGPPRGCRWRRGVSSAVSTVEFRARNSAIVQKVKHSARSDEEYLRLWLARRYDRSVPRRQPRRHRRADPRAARRRRPPLGERDRPPRRPLAGRRQAPDRPARELGVIRGYTRDPRPRKAGRAARGVLRAALRPRDPGRRHRQRRRRPARARRVVHARRRPRRARAPVG